MYRKVPAPISDENIEKLCEELNMDGSSVPTYSPEEAFFFQVVKDTARGKPMTISTQLYNETRSKVLGKSSVG